MLSLYIHSDQFYDHICIISHCIILKHIILYHIRTISYRFMNFILYHLTPSIMLCYIISHHISYIIPYHLISFHLISYDMISYHIIPYHTISYHIISYHITSCHILYHTRKKVLRYVNITKPTYHITLCHSISYRKLHVHHIISHNKKSPLYKKTQNYCHLK